MLAASKKKISSGKAGRRAPAEVALVFLGAAGSLSATPGCRRRNRDGRGGAEGEIDAAVWKADIVQDSVEFLWRNDAANLCPPRRPKTRSVCSMRVPSACARANGSGRNPRTGKNRVPPPAPASKTRVQTPRSTSDDPAAVVHRPFEPAAVAVRGDGQSGARRPRSRARSGWFRRPAPARGAGRFRPPPSACSAPWWGPAFASAGRKSAWRRPPPWPAA